MEKNKQWIYAEFVRKWWGICELTLETIVMDYGLPIYDSNDERENVEDGIPSFIDRYKFKSEDIEKFASEN